MVNKELKEPVDKYSLMFPKNHSLMEELGSDICLEMVTIPGGQFLMGSSEDSLQAYDNEKPQHLVKLKPFLMSKYLITQAQWQAVASLNSVDFPLNSQPSRNCGADHPVEQVSWYEAVEFCERLSKQTKRKYRLPSEAEWEYACRARTTTPFSCGEKLPSNLANCHEKTLPSKLIAGTTPVGAFGFSNGFDLYDMHGNVYEWCLDYWHDDYDGALTDGSAWLSLNETQERVIRGGFWHSYPQHCRCAYRDSFEPNQKSSTIGFRIVCEISVDC